MSIQKNRLNNFPNQKDNMWDVFNPTLQQRQKSNPPSSKPQSSSRSSKNASTKLPPLVQSKSNSNVIQNSQRQQLQNQLLLESVTEQQIQLPQPMSLVSKGDSQLIDIQSRIRQVQASLQRRISRISQELPSRMQRDSKIQQQRNSNLIKQNQSNIISQQDALLIVKESMKVHFQDFNHRIVQLSGKNQELNQRAKALQKDSEKVERIISTFSRSVTNEVSVSKVGDAGGSDSQTNNSLQLELQIKSLKQALNQQKRVHKNQIQDLLQKNRDTREELQLQSRQIISKIFQQRDISKKGQNFVEHQSQQRDIQISQKYKAENSLLLSKIQMIQKSFEDEKKQYQRAQSQMYSWMQEKIKALNSQILREQRGKIQRESVMYEQFKDGFSTVNQMLNNHKEEGKFNMTKTQFLLTDAMQQLNEQLDQLRQASIVRLEKCQLNDQEFRSILSEAQIATAKQNQTIHQNMQREFLRFQQMVSALQTRSNDIQSELGSRITTIDDGLHKWKKEFTTKNEQRLVELQNAIKQTISYIGKASQESKARDKYLGEEMKSIQKQFDSSISELRSKIQGDDLAVEERVSKMSTHLFEKLSQIVAQKQANLSGLAQSLSEKVKNENMQHMEELKGKIGKMVERLKSDIRQESKQRNIMIQGGAQAFALGIEKRLKEQIKNLNKLASQLKSQLDKSIKKQQADLEIEKKSRINSDDQNKNELRNAIQEQKKSLTSLLHQGDQNSLKRSRHQIDLLKDELSASIATSISQSKNQRKRLSQQKSSEIQISAKKLSLEITQKVTDEHKEMVSKFSQLVKLHDIQKKVVDETISRHLESMKALTKALITQQKAQRQAKNQEILHLTNSRIDKLQLALNNGIDSRAEELRAQIKLQGDAYQAKLSSLDLNIKKELNDISQSVGQKAEELRGQIKLQEEANQAKLQSLDTEVKKGITDVSQSANQKAEQLKNLMNQQGLAYQAKVNDVSMNFQIFKAQNGQAIEKLSERADHIHQRVNQLSQDHNKLKIEVGQQTLRLDGEIRQSSVKFVVGELIERVSNEDELRAKYKIIEKELMQTQGRIQEVRELMQNNIDHAMSKILGQDQNGLEKQDGYGGGLKGKILKIDEKVQALSNQVDQKLNTWDFKIVQIEQKVVRVEEDNKKQENSKGQDLALKDIREIKQELKSMDEVKQYGARLYQIETRIQNLQDQKPQAPPSDE